MGCGRAGTALALKLVNRGHSVAVIDQNPDAFNRLPDDFPGQQVTGVGFDRKVLCQAGIEEAQGFAAVSSGDNSNIIAARVVRDTFGVENVVARIYDRSRAEIYERLGIEVVIPVAWTARQMERALIPLGPHIEHIDAVNDVALFYVDLHESWFGLTVADIERNTNARVAYIVRNVNSLLPAGNTVLQDGDELHMLGPVDRTGEIQRVLNYPVKETQL